MAATVESLLSACKDGDMGRVGISQGHFIVDEDGDLVPYEGYNGRLGLEDIMEALAEFFTQVQRNDEGKILGCSRQLSSVALGLGGQVVVSVEPQLNLSALESEYKNVMFRLEQILEPVEYSVVVCGYLPRGSVTELVPVPNPQLQALEDELGEGALPLLRGAAGCRLMLEYADEADAVRKLRVATLLGPVLAALTENTPVFEDDPSVNLLAGMVLRRSACEERGGTVPGLFSPDFGFEAFAAWSEQGFECADAVLQEGVLLRLGDALPGKVAIGYAALLKGLFYGPVSLELLEHFLGLEEGALPYDDASVEKTVNAIEAEGMSAKVYGRTADEWVDLLLRIAPEGLGTESASLEPLREFRGY